MKYTGKKTYYYFVDGFGDKYRFCSNGTIDVRIGNRWEDCGDEKIEVRIKELLKLLKDVER